MYAIRTIATLLMGAFFLWKGLSDATRAQVAGQAPNIEGLTRAVDRDLPPDTWPISTALGLGLIGFGMWRMSRR